MKNPEKENRVITIRAILLVLLIGVIAIIAVRSVMIGPGIPPDADMSYLMLSDQGPSFERCPLIQNGSKTPPGLCVDSIREGNYPHFPELSPSSRYGIFGNTGSGESMVIAVWYFKRENDFVLKEGQLVKYLQDHGIINKGELDFSAEQQVIKKRNLENPRESRLMIPQTVQGTAYSDNETAGYFFVIQRPISLDREDYYLMYYGVVTNNTPSSATPSLKLLMAENNGYYTFRGVVRPLGQI
ncbi:MAG: hypothetical protein M0R30_10730 [Methanoregula sp.]|uniref:hypothetical protein n=1 Tax=Methanoregula sp. TaxID=2052170 RepID=UPI0025FD60DD|nr:hypothetical protein [Methanoregula sp.]MCK9632103.1 hypothetical protein [Methanoregula sp.]